MKIRLRKIYFACLFAVIAAAPARADLAPAAVSCGYMYDRYLSKYFQNAGGYDPGTSSFWFQNIYHMARARDPFLLQKSQDPFIKKAGQFLGRNLVSLGRVITPIPLPMRGRNELEKLFITIWKNPAYEPTAAERALLKKYDQEKFFEGRKKFLQAHQLKGVPYAKYSKNAMAWTRNTLAVAGAAAAVVQARDISEGQLSPEEYLARAPEDEEGNPVVQLLVETTPLPHTALRIGHKVYSYGQEFMTSKPVGTYMDEGKSSADSSSAQSVTAPPIEALEKVGPRAVRVTTLNLPKDVVAKLQRQLEMNTGKKYENNTMVNDCATMIKRALEENDALQIPVLIDAFPSVSSTYLSLRQAFGDKRVAKTELVTYGTEGKKFFNTARNTYIAMMESKVLTSLLLSNSAYRAGMEAYYGRAKLEYYLPEVQAEINAFQLEASGEVERGLNSLLGDGEFFQKLAKVKDPKERKERIAAARALMDSVAKRMQQEAQETIDYSGSEMKDVVRATEKISTLKRLRPELERRLRDVEP